MARKQFHLSWMSLALGLTVSMGAGSIHAQSSYSMTTLGLGTTNQNLFTPPYNAWIDTQDRVWSNMRYYEGKKLETIWDPSPGGSLFPKFVWRETYHYYPVRHAGTGATSSPTKLSSKSGTLQVVSPNGQRAYLIGGAYALTAVSPSPALTLDAGSMALALQDSGAYTGRILPPAPAQPVEVQLTDFPALWVPGQPRQDLTVPAGYRGGMGLALNTRNEVAGAIFTFDHLVAQAAVWRQGQLTVLDSAADQASFAIGISELGHVLVANQFYKIQITNPAIPSYDITEGPVDYTVFYNGQRLRLGCATALPRAVASAISPGGLVVGQCAPAVETLTRSSSGPFTTRPSVPTGLAYGGKAWIWKDGVGSELAGYLAARGVKLPAGMVLRNVMAVNAKGSMVVETMNASGQLGLARFTALN